MTNARIMTYGSTVNHHDSWRQGWSPQVQARWADRVFSIALSKPFVETVIWADLCDHADAAVPGDGLVAGNGEAKPALARLVGLRKRLRKPLGPMRSAAAVSPAQ